VLDELYDLGKGTKKGELQRQMEKLTGERISHFIHSSTTKVRYERAAMKFVDFLEEQGIKRDKHLNRTSTEELQKIVNSYFEKLAKDGLSKNTIKTHIAALEKSLAVIRPDIKPYLQSDENRVRWWSAGKASQKRYAYADPEAIRNRLSDINRMIAEAQAMAGFRVREIAKAEINKEEYKITIKNGKGGRTRELYFEHRKEDFKKLVDLIEKLQNEKYEKHLKDYYEDLKRACKSTGQEYRAAHSFRHEYAERRIEELRQNRQELRDLLDKYGADDEMKSNANDEDTVDIACDFVLTRELGHNRLKMSRYYYR
jgi:16S rRNA C967 or C1407 C5-methylase (RsmB/RsmF family)